MQEVTDLYKSKPYHVSSEDDNYPMLSGTRNMKIRTFIIHHTCYSISTGFNTFVVDGVTYTFASGNYNITNLLDALVLAIPTLVSYVVNALNYKVELTFNVPVVIGESYITKMLGFNSGDSGTVLLAGNIYNLAYRFRKGLYIVSSNVSNTYHEKRNSVISVVPLTSPFGSIITVDHRSHDDAFILIDRHGELNVDVLDSDFQPINFNGYPWSVELSIKLK